MSVEEYGRYAEPAVLILTSLAEGDKHGYGLVKDIESFADVRLGPGTLYRTISRLLADGLVEEVEGGDPDAPHDARRRYYRLTPQGRQAAQAEAGQLQRLVAAATQAGLLPAKESP